MKNFFFTNSMKAILTVSIIIMTGSNVRAQTFWTGSKILVNEVVSGDINLNGDEYNGFEIIVANGDTAAISGKLHGNLTNLLISGGGKLVISSTKSDLSVTSVKVATGTMLQFGNGTKSGDFPNAAEYVLAENAIFRFHPGGTHPIYSKPITGAGKVEKAGDWRPYFTGDNTYTGGTTVEAGGFFIGNGETIGSISDSGGITVKRGATIYFHRSDEYTHSGFISGEGNVGKYATGKLILNGVYNYSGNTIIPDGTIVLGATANIENSELVSMGMSGIFDLSEGDKTIKSLWGYGEVKLGSRMLTINNVENSISNNKFTGTGGVIKTGTGYLEMKGVSTANGMFNHNEGEVRLSTNGSWGGNYNKAAGTTLGLIYKNFTIGGNLTLAGGNINMTLSGPYPAQLSVGGAVMQSGTGINTINVTDIGTAAVYTLITAASGISLSNFILTGITGYFLMVSEDGRALMLIKGEQPDYAIAASPKSLSFGSLLTGYTTPPDARTVTIINYGKNSVTLYQPTPVAGYTITTPEPISLAPNATTTFTIQPNAELPNGVYNKTISITGTNGVSSSVEVDFGVMMERRRRVLPQ